MVCSLHVTPTVPACVVNVFTRLLCNHTSIPFGAESDARFLHLLDSQVAIGVVSKGRSASLPLARVADKIAALTLAGRLRPLVAYVATDDNPADAPSRKRLWRGARRQRAKRRRVTEPAAVVGRAPLSPQGAHA